jgi:hypothetical protein
MCHFFPLWHPTTATFTRHETFKQDAMVEIRRGKSTKRVLFLWSSLFETSEQNNNPTGSRGKITITKTSNNNKNQTKQSYDVKNGSGIANKTKNSKISKKKSNAGFNTNENIQNWWVCQTEKVKCKFVKKCKREKGKHQALIDKQSEASEGVTLEATMTALPEIRRSQC